MCYGRHCYLMQNCIHELTVEERLGYAFVFRILVWNRIQGSLYFFHRLCHSQQAIFSDRSALYKAYDSKI